MAPTPRWFNDIERILAALPVRGVVTRPDIERIFGVRTTEARRLLMQLDAEDRRGNGRRIVPVARLRTWLEARKVEADRDDARRATIAEALAAVAPLEHGRSKILRIERDKLPTTPQMPTTVRIVGDELRVRFTDALDLFTQLQLLASAAASIPGDDLKPIEDWIQSARIGLDRRKTG